MTIVELYKVENELVSHIEANRKNCPICDSEVVLISSIDPKGNYYVEHGCQGCNLSKRFINFQSSINIDGDDMSSSKLIKMMEELNSWAEVNYLFNLLKLQN